MSFIIPFNPDHSMILCGMWNQGLLHHLGISSQRDGGTNTLLSCLGVMRDEQSRTRRIQQPTQQSQLAKLTQPSSVPAGNQLSQAVIRQYYNPPDVDALFGAIPSPKLEHIFYKSKPRYFKRTSSAVWHSPPGSSCGPSCTFQS